MAAFKFGALPRSFFFFFCIHLEFGINVGSPFAHYSGTRWWRAAERGVCHENPINRPATEERVSLPMEYLSFKFAGPRVFSTRRGDVGR